MKTDLATNQEATAQQVHYLRDTVQMIIDKMQALLAAALAKKQELADKEAKARVRDIYSVSQGYRDWADLVGSASLETLHKLVANLDEQLIEHTSKAMYSKENQSDE